MERRQITKFNEAQLAYLEKLIQFKGDDPEDGFNVLSSVEGDVRGDVGGSVEGDVFETVGKGQDDD